MEITLKRVNDAVHFEAQNADGNRVQVDGSAPIGGEGAGFRPMELLLTSIAACASMDFVMILKKQRQTLNDVTVTVSGERREGSTPTPFEAVHIVWTVTGEVDRTKAEHAAELAVTKYCSVAETLSPSVRITWEVQVASRG